MGYSESMTTSTEIRSDGVSFRHPRALFMFLVTTVIWATLVASLVYFLTGLPILGAAVIGWVSTPVYMLFLYGVHTILERVQK